MEARPKIICLTPVKNESWILDRFLKCASLWADYIIISDQMSTDGSDEIAKRFEKVRFIRNNYQGEFNELQMRSILIDEARKIEAPRILISLDADEALSADAINSDDWKKILQAKPGSAFKIQLINILPNGNSAWKASYLPRIFVDDGTAYSSEKIHTNNIPLNPGSEIEFLKEIKLLHYQFADWARMQSKHRWYMCWEVINRPNRRYTEIYRQYHHMYAVPFYNKMNLKKSWLSGYEDSGIDMKKISVQSSYRWDDEVLNYFKTYGTKKFSGIMIWDRNWGNDFKDPRGSNYKRLHSYLQFTQPLYGILPFTILLDVLDKMVEKLIVKNGSR